MHAVPVSGWCVVFQICENLDNGWTERWVEEQKVPYAVHRDQWVGYENEHSVQLKVLLRQ